MHPRLFLLGPLYVLTLWAAAGAFRSLGTRARVGVLFGALLVVCGLVFSALIQRTVALHAVVQPPNPVRLGGGPWPLVLAYAALVLALAGLLLKQRATLRAGSAD
jgi:hypothetical protein